jgi:hypothetical protein
VSIFNEHPVASIGSSGIGTWKWVFLSFNIFFYIIAFSMMDTRIKTTFFYGACIKLTHCVAFIMPKYKKESELL